MGGVEEIETIRSEAEKSWHSITVVGMHLVRREILHGITSIEELALVLFIWQEFREECIGQKRFQAKMEGG